MINGKTVVGIIPARAGSKRVPRKNVRDLGGKPLVAWTVETAMKSRFLDQIVLTSDDDDVFAAAAMTGRCIRINRPHDLATDDATSADVVIHALDLVGEKFHYAVLLQPTSPFREADDIDAAVALCDSKSAESCVSVSETSVRPEWLHTLDNDGVLHRLAETQNSRKFSQGVVLNGAVYVVVCDAFRRKRKFVDENSVGYLMPRNRAIDIDDEFDFSVAELFKRQ